MAELREILLASDFSARSDRPLERAAALANDWDAKLVIAHVLEGKAASNDEAAIERLRDDLPAFAAGAELVVRSGSTPNLLVTIAAERGSSLIVTGVARYNSIGDYLLGTAVDHIVRNAEVPVLVVCKRADHPYSRIVVATDFSDCSHAALVAAGHLFPEARIDLVHAFHVPYEGWLKSDDVRDYVRGEDQEGMDRFLAGPTIPAELRDRIDALVEEGETGSVIVRRLRDSGANLLVMGTHGRSGFAHATIGSQAEALLAGVDTDVLMVRENKRARA